MGNLTRDPELRVTPKGTAICQFGIAVNRQFKGEDGAMRDDTTFVDVEAWGKTGENISKYFTKGKPIFVEGRLKLDSWEDKATGQKRSKMKVVCEQFQFIGGKDENAGGSSPDRRAAPPARNQTPDTHGGNGGDMEDVPFARMEGPCV
jgi:single-strand DNA-binding protein